MSDTGRENDPFSAFESERTVIKPTGGRQAPAAGNAASGVTQPGPSGSGAGRVDAGGKEAPLPLDALMTASLNPLVAAASPLLSAAPRIRAMVQHPNPAGLKDALADGVRKFEARARAEGLPNEQVIAARYILCTLLDESAASTPWGGSGVWSNQSLLVLFHNETWGGEKVFQLMSRWPRTFRQPQPARAMYVALAFGSRAATGPHDGKRSSRACASACRRCCAATVPTATRRCRRAGKACRSRTHAWAPVCRCGSPRRSQASFSSGSTWACGCPSTITPIPSSPAFRAWT